MKIVVTGGCGKIGKWVVRELLHCNNGISHSVTVFDRFAGPEQEQVHYLAGDILDLGQVFEAVSGADAIIHLAAIRKNGLVPDDVTFRTNVMGAFNVHEAARRLGISRVVTASSQAILGWDYREKDFFPEYLPIDEDHPVNPQDAYGLSKETTEAIARSYAQLGMDTIILRPNFVVSPEQLNQLTREGGRRPERFILYSYVDVRDLAVAFRLAVEKPIVGGTVLFVVANDSCVMEPLCDLLPRLLPGLGNKANHLTGSKAAISNARARQFLGWNPKYSWRDYQC